MGHARCQEARTPVRVTREARWKATQVYLILGYKVMGRPRPERKSEPKAPTERRVPPIELQVGDRLTVLRLPMPKPARRRPTLFL